MELYASTPKRTRSKLPSRRPSRWLGATAVGLVLAAGPAGAAVEASYLYDLANVGGPVGASWAVVRADPESRDVFVVDPAVPTVGVFNGSGMEVYRFGEDGRLGMIADLAALEGGDLLVLARSGPQYLLTRCDFRGEPLRRVELAGVPAAFAEAVPDMIVHRSGRTYLADLSGMMVLVVDGEGRFLEGYDLAALLEIPAKGREGCELVGFDVDHRGNLLFTIPVFFQAYVVSPDRKVRAFGERGSRPGKFNIVGGIAADEDGWLYVVDQLRCVVMVFDPEFRFETEFGFRGERPGNLVSPRNVLAEAGRVYVNQSGNRAIRVFRVHVG